MHFFWGSFDLAATRFSGRVAPKHPGGVPGLPDAVTCEAYSHEEASVGFWLGLATPIRTRRSTPMPIRRSPVMPRRRSMPAQAAWNADLGEFLLPYEAVATAADPNAALLAFCQSTYDADRRFIAAWDMRRARMSSRSSTDSPPSVIVLRRAYGILPGAHRRSPRLHRTKQPVFFVATAAAGARINLSPKGMDSVPRARARTSVAYLDLGGSGNETQAHLGAGWSHHDHVLRVRQSRADPADLRHAAASVIAGEADGFDDHRRVFPAVAPARTASVRDRGG